MPHAVLSIPKADYLDIDNLQRIDWDDSFYHPNPELANKMKHVSGQVYVLKGTIYGCFVVKLDNGALDFQWFGYHKTSVSEHTGKITPDSTLSLSEVLNRCDPEKVLGLLFNLDVLSGKLR